VRFLSRSSRSRFTRRWITAREKHSREMSFDLRRTSEPSIGSSQCAVRRSWIKYLFVTCNHSPRWTFSPCLRGGRLVDRESLRKRDSIESVGGDLSSFPALSRLFPGSFPQLFPRAFATKCLRSGLIIFRLIARRRQLMRVAVWESADGVRLCDAIASKRRIFVARAKRVIRVIRD